MTHALKTSLLLAAAATLAACQAAETDEAAELEAVQEAAETQVAETTMSEPEVVDVMRDDQDISTLPAGLYTDEDGHAYIAFSYSHQGYSNPILRFNGDAFDARMTLVPDNPTASTLDVDLDPSMIDSGVAAFDEHLRSGDFFDVDTHPDAGFTTTSLAMDTPTTGTLVGDLTVKGVTRPVSLDVTLNKVGKNFRTEVPMFGVSATGQIKRSDFELGLYAPMVGDEVDLMIEIEFQKAEEGEG